MDLKNILRIKNVLISVGFQMPPNRWRSVVEMATFQIIVIAIAINTVFPVIPIWGIWGAILDRDFFWKNSRGAIKALLGTSRFPFERSRWLGNIQFKIFFDSYERFGKIQFKIDLYENFNH